MTNNLKKLEVEIINEFDKLFKPPQAKNWDIELVWNENNQPLVWGATCQSIKKQILYFISSALSRQRQEISKMIEEMKLGSNPDEDMEKVADMDSFNRALEAIINKLKV